MRGRESRPKKVRQQIGSFAAPRNDSALINGPEAPPHPSPECRSEPCHHAKIRSGGRFASTGGQPMRMGSLRSCSKTAQTSGRKGSSHCLSRADGSCFEPESVVNPRYCRLVPSTVFLLATSKEGSEFPVGEGGKMERAFRIHRNLGSGISRGYSSSISSTARSR